MRAAATAAHAQRAECTVCPLSAEQHGALEHAAPCSCSGSALRQSTGVPALSKGRLLQRWSCPGHWHRRPASASAQAAPPQPSDQVRQLACALLSVTCCCEPEACLVCSETSISEALRYSLNRRSTLQTIRRMHTPPPPAEPPRYQASMLQTVQQVCARPGLQPPPAGCPGLMPAVCAGGTGLGAGAPPAGGAGI